MRYEEKFSMRCEKCQTPTRSMVCIPKRKRADGTIICFWQLCLKCAKEVINEREKKTIRSMPAVRKVKFSENRRRKKRDVLQVVQRNIRRIGVKNDTKKKQTENNKNHNCQKHKSAYGFKSCFSFSCFFKIGGSAHFSSSPSLSKS